jgi:hypothetical protein
MARPDVQPGCLFVRTFQDQRSCVGLGCPPVKWQQLMKYQGKLVNDLSLVEPEVWFSIILCFIFSPLA